ncbi:MAG: NUDIX hydrolase, partial [Rhodothermaceae bacterium]|nr:NUDIX hydrolase [Rhodothermaceae bacterium]
MNSDGNQDIEEKKLASEKMFSGKLLHVYKDSVQLPDGNSTIREWIDHPGASAIIPLFEDGTTLLVEQYRYPVQRIMLEIPAGKRDGNEPFIETANRELDEETGWKAGKIVDL